MTSLICVSGEKPWRFTYLCWKYPNQITQGQMSYDLRRLRLHGIIERIESTHRYRLTASGMKTAFLYSRLYLRALRPALSHLHAQSQAPHLIQQTFHRLQRQIDDYYTDKLAV
jgi:DNA-binding HxlR family transcriptional regulator